jgi:hypothetical protein
MPNNNIDASVSIEEYQENEEYGPDDFGFIIGPDGELKSFMIPEHLMKDPPEEITMILSLFGIEDMYELENKTLH